MKITLEGVMNSDDVNVLLSEQKDNIYIRCGEKNSAVKYKEFKQMCEIFLMIDRKDRGEYI